MDFNPSTAESLSLIASAGVAGVGLPELIVTGASFTSPLIDVRQFSSYYLQFNVRTNLVTTGFNPLQVDLAWQSDTNVITPTTIFQDPLRVWADSGAAPIVALGRVYAQDTMHGSFMQITFTNKGPDTLSLTYQLMGTTRILPRPFAKQQNGLSNVLQSMNGTLAAGGQLDVPANYASGTAYFRAFSDQTSTWSIIDAHGDLVDTSDPGLPGLRLAANTLYKIPNLILPRSAVKVRLDNAGGAVANFNFILIWQGSN